MIMFFWFFSISFNFFNLYLHNQLSANCDSKNLNEIRKNSSDLTQNDTVHFYSVREVFDTYQLKKQIVIRVTIFLILIGLIRLLCKYIFDDFYMMPAMYIQNAFGFKLVHRSKKRMCEIMVCRNFINGLNLFSCFLNMFLQFTFVKLFRYSITWRFSSPTRNLTCN